MNFKNYFKLLLVVVTISGFVNQSHCQVMINEFSCSNISIPDNYGNNSDWIELYNAGGSSVSLTGYYLSDKINNPTKWAIPAGVSIAGNGYLIIWASGKNTVAGGNVHAGITLTQTKPEALVFANPSGAIIDSMTLKPTQVSHSRGRTTNGGPTWGVFTSPTPGAPNTGAKLEYATCPIMSVPAGFYSGPQTVTITAPGTGLTIYYTTNGSTPTTSSTLYSSPVSISSTTVLRARAFSSNTLVPASFVESNTYFINNNHTIAVVSIFGDQIMTLMNGSQINPETGLEYFNVAKQQKAETDGTSNKHGNDSWAYDQRGIDFKSMDEFGYNYAVNEKLFINKSRASFPNIILKAAANDNYPFETGGAHIRDSYCHTLSQRGNLHLDERTWAPCILYVNGQYWGVYDLREKVDDADFTSYYYNQPGKKLQFLKTWGATWSAYGGTQAQTDWNALRTFITSNNMAVQSNYNYVDSLFNVKSLADYIILNSYCVTTDWLNWNTGWWRGLNPSSNKGKKWRYILWDNDATFGHYINYTGVPDTSPSADPCNPESLPDPGGQGHIDILNALLANPGFKQYYESRFIDLLNTTLSCTYMQSLLDSMVAVIQPEMAGQVARWGGTVSGWQTNVTAMKNFITARCAAINQGMVNCYNLTGPYNITLDVQPVGSGIARINTTTPASYIWSGTYFGNIQTIFKAKANTGWVFDHWEFQNHTPSPSTINDSVSVTITQNDNVIAVFRKPNEPPGGEETGVPTAFSPNGDGNNDVLFVLGSITDLEFIIYNRWGQQVFKTTDRSKGWDGTFNGQPLNPDVFAYKLHGTLSDGTKIERKGNITLVR